MIHIKHFIAERDGKNTAPNWSTAEQWMNTLSDAGGRVAEILEVKAYPSPTHHNLILIVDDKK